MLNFVRWGFLARATVLHAGLLLCSSAQAGTAQLGCTFPTLNTDGTAIKAPVTVKFFWGTTPTGPFPNASPVQTACAYTWTNLVGGMYYFTGAAIDGNGTQSALSAVASKLVPGSTPNPPTVPQPVSLAGPVFSLQITKNSMVVPQIGTVLAGKPCDPTQQFAFNGVTYMRIDTANVVPLGNVDLSQTATWTQCQ